MNLPNVPPGLDHRLEFFLDQLRSGILKLDASVEEITGEPTEGEQDTVFGPVTPINYQFITAAAVDATDQSVDLTGQVGDGATAVCLVARGKTNDGADILLDVKQNSGASYQPLLHWGFIEANGGQATGMGCTWIALEGLGFIYNLNITGTTVTDAWVVAWS